MTIKKVIEILQAYDRGEVVQAYNAISKKWEDVDLKSAWDSKNIRIKPKCQEPEFVPYDNAEEFLQAQREHGPYLCACNQYKLPILVDDTHRKGVVLGSTTPWFYDYEHILDSHVWQDGTRCGKLK